MGRLSVDMIGKRYGQLVVLDVAHRDDHRQLHYKAKCDCGNTIVARGANIRNGLTTSCGCARSVAHKGTAHKGTAHKGTAHRKPTARPVARKDVANEPTRRNPFLKR